ncbi:dynamin family protein [Tessaracoccus sp. MC1627]|uniref:dynamin family protein n=1 Tax=Tessaracoccus sp. MC1627 TaxID=2760312 RepID=UPI0015FF1CEC|nr:dynamin family protein [Tessaracoccus sp. MC1627]MBB1511197.1 dynamin family protein [Tessaracoccus sp. MC1627]
MSDQARGEVEGALVLPNQKSLIGLVETMGAMAANGGRTDLSERLVQTHARLRDPEVRVVIVGEFKQGKSKLINALVNAPVCPIDDDVATSVPTAVGYGEAPAATILTRSETHGGKSEIQRQPIRFEELAQYVSELGNPGNERHLVSAEVVLPREILRGGLRLVDSPGIGSLDSSSALTTLSALSSAHAVLMVSDASQEYTEPEVQLLKHAMRISPNVAAVLAKTDLYPDWRTIEGIDKGHLEGIGELPLFAVSSDLRLLAASEQDRELNNESGFPDLVSHLRLDVLRRAEVINTRSAVHDLVFVVDQMTMAARTELTALLNPEDTPQLILQLEEAKARADEFRGRSSRWQVALGDGVADLISDMEHDLRDRLRRVQREAEDAIDQGDPGPIWEQIAEWIDQRVAAAVSETFVWTDERGKALTEEIADLFIQDETSLPVIAVGATDGVLDAVDEIPDYHTGQLGAVEKIYIGVRGSYGGVLMVGLATGLIGMTLINPLSLLAGVLVGRRAYREDMNSRLLRRRFEAKGIVRRYIDEVTFQVSKQLKDRLRIVQRTARDHFGAIADQLHRSLTEAVMSAKQSAGIYSEKRDKRVLELQNHLRQLDKVRAQLPELPQARVKEVLGR